jgi:hypothetical protein
MTSSGERSPDRVATAFGGGKLVEVVVTTREGARYVFPDMAEGELRKVLPESGRLLASMPSLMMANASVAVLTIPFRIIKTIEVGGEVLWASPA